MVLKNNICCFGDFFYEKFSEKKKWSFLGGVWQNSDFFYENFWYSQAIFLVTQLLITQFWTKKFFVSPPPPFMRPWSRASEISAVFEQKWAFLLTLNSCFSHVS